jgi:hypothetical protein
MYKTIFKYPFNINDQIILRLPKGFEIVSVILDPTLVKGSTNFWLYARVDSEEREEEQYEIRIFGTGNRCDIDISQYENLGTIVDKCHDMIFIWHIFGRRI